MSTTVVDFLGNVILGDGSVADGGDDQVVTLPEAIEHVRVTSKRYEWMSLALHAAAGYAIAGLLRSPIRIRGSGHTERDYSEWLWNVRPNPNQSRAQFVTALIDQMFFSRQGYALVVPSHNSIWVADSWIKVTAPTNGEAWWRPDTYESITINGQANAIAKLTSNEVFVFRLPETSEWRRLIKAMSSAYKDMAKSAVEAFGDKNARRWLLEMDAKITGTQKEQDKINDYLKDSIGPFVKGTDIAIPLYQGMHLTRAKADYSGGESTLDVVQIRAEAFKTVANCLRIPVSFLEGNVNNYETVFESALTFFLDPIAKAIEDEIAAKSLTATMWQKGDKVRVDTTHVRHVDLFAVADKAEKLVGSMIDTPNEIREFTGQDASDVPGMDDYQMTKNHAAVGGGDNNDSTQGANPADGG